MESDRRGILFGALALLVLALLLALAWGLFRAPPADDVSPLAAPASPGSDWDPSVRLERAWHALLGRGRTKGGDASGAHLGSRVRPGDEAFGAVEGRVVLEPDDRGCRNAFVLLVRVGTAPRETVTDEAGAFRLDRVPVGRWILRARDADGRVAVRLLLVQDERTTRLGRLRMGSGAFVEVRVRRVDGAPAPGAPAPGAPAPGVPAPGVPAPGVPAPGVTVRILAPRDVYQDLLDGALDSLEALGGVDGPAITRRAETDASGRALFEGLDPGPVVVEARLDGFVPASAETLLTERGAAGGPVELTLTPGRTIQGVVVDERGRGLARAWVCVYDPDGAKRPLHTVWFQPTDAQGRFTEVLPAGATRVHALVGAPGRPMHELLRELEGEELRLELGAAATLVVEATRAGTDEPAVDVGVHAFGGVAARPGVPSAARWVAQARTNFKGRAVLPVRPGWLYVLAVEYAPGGHDNWVPWVGIDDEGPCVFRGQEGGKLEAGENVVRVEAPAPRPPARLVGRVHDEDEGPLAGARIFVEGEVGIDPRTESPAVSDEDGRFVVRVPRDEHVYVDAVLPGWVMRYTGVAAVGEDADEAEEDIEMQPASAVTGRVVDERGLGVESVRVRVVAAHFEPQTTRPGLAGPTFAVTGPDGWYLLDGLRSAVGAYLVAVGDGYVPSASRKFRVREGRTLRAPHLVLRASVTLRVRVLDPDGRPVPRARVVARSLDDPLLPWSRDLMARVMEEVFPGLYADASEQGVTDASGRATIPGVIPGRVALTAGRRGFVSATKESVHPLLRPAGGVHVLRLHAAFAFDGVLVDPAGQPVPNARVYLRRPDGADAREREGVAWSGRSAWSDDRGRFAFEDVPFASLELYVEADGFRGLREAAPTGPGSVRLVLTRADPALVRRLAEVEAESRRIFLERYALEEEGDEEDEERIHALYERESELQAEEARLREALGLDAE